MLHKGKRIIWLLAFGDAVLIVAAFILGYYARFTTVFTTITSAQYDQYLSAMIFVTLMWLALFKLFGLYEERSSQPFIDEAALVSVLVTIGSLFLVAMLFLNRGLWFSRQFFFYAWMFAIIFLVLYRYSLVLLQRFLFANGYFLRRTLIVGAGRMGQALAEKLEYSGYGFNVVGFIDDNPTLEGKTIDGLPVLGNSAAIKTIVQEKKIAEVIIGTVKIANEKVLDIITECEVFKVGFKLVPGMLNMLASRVDMEEIAGFPLLTVSEIQLQGFKAFAKRSFDIILCLTLSIVVLPVILLIALLIVMDSRGWPIFRQKRIGKDGKPFGMLKFRTMVSGAEEKFKDIEHLGDTKGLYFKIKDDPRITRAGKVLRRFSLDEIPQFINVIIGDMSLVGPRPPLPYEVEKYSSWHWKRLRVLPGITGLWQVSGKARWDIPFEEVVKQDLLYIENWSLWLDLKIILRTIPAMLLGSGC